MKSRLGYSIAGLAMAVLLAMALQPTTAPVVAADGDASALFAEHKCNLCHSVAAAGIEAKVKSEKMKGPDLGGYANEDRAWVDDWVRKQIERDGATHKREYQGSDDDLTAILKWVASLEPAR